MSKFKVGQKVKCIDNSGAPDHYTVGKVYTVSKVLTFDFSEDLIRTEETEAGMLEKRFEAYVEAPKSATKFFVIDTNGGVDAFPTLEAAEEAAREYAEAFEEVTQYVVQAVKAFRVTSEVQEVTLA